MPLGGVVVFSPGFRKRVEMEFFFKMMAAFPTHSSFLHRRVCNKARTDVITQRKRNTNGI